MAEKLPDQADFRNMGIIGPTPEEAVEVNQLNSTSEKIKNPFRKKLSKIISSVVMGITGATLLPPSSDVPPQAQIQDAGPADTQGFSIQERKAEASQSLVKNETSSGQLNIESEILNLMDSNIKESGLEGIVGGIIIRDFNDPIFTPPEIYGELISAKGLNKFSATTAMEKKPGSEVYQLNMYLPNTPTSKQTVLHEIGHIPDWIPYLSQYPNELPDRIKNNLIDPEFEAKYHDRFINYLNAIPSDELAPFAVPYEKTIVMGKSNELGDKLWPDLLSEIDSQDESLKYVIPGNKLQEIIEKMKDGLAKKALEWYTKGLDEEKEKTGYERAYGNDFATEAWGRFLMKEYYQNPEGLEKQFSSQFENIKKEILETEERCRKEEWAEIWAIRVLNREEAIRLDENAVDAQEKLVSTLISLR